jgi:uncharacterized protein (TIGR03086 family)
MERIDPVEPIDRIDPDEPMLRIEPPALPGPEELSLPMTAFWHRRRPGIMAGLGGAGTLSGPADKTGHSTPEQVQDMADRLAAGPRGPGPATPARRRSESMSDTAVLADLDRALAATEQIVAGIGPGQWPDPTPCTELNVREVLNHLVSGNLLFAALARKDPPPDRTADHLGDDPLGAFQRTGRELREAFSSPGALEAVYTAPFGTGPGVVLVHVRIGELLAHGWDLARATGQPADFPADLAEQSLAGLRRQLSSRPEGPGAPFGPEVAVPGDASAIDRLAGFLGRTV